MKRFLSIMMASVLMVLTLSTGLTAMAESITTSQGDKTLTAAYTVADGGTETLTPSYDVDISVTNDLKATYTKKYKQQWNSTSHEIETVLDEDKSGWNSTVETVTITNNSNVGVKLTVSGGGANNGATCRVENAVSGEWLNPTEKYVVKVSFSGVPNESATEATVGAIYVRIG